MKQLFFTIFLLFTCLLTVQTQESEQFGELIPYTKWWAKVLAKVEEENRRIVCDMRLFIPKGKIKANFKVETKSFSNEESVLVIEVQTKSSELIFDDRGGNLISQTRFFGRITSKSRNFDKVFEEIIEIPTSLEQIDQFFPVVYRRAIKLPKDKYTINFVVNSVDTENIATKKFKIEIK